MHGRVAAITCREATRQFRNYRLETNEMIRGAKKMSRNATSVTPFPLGVFVGNPNYYSLSQEVSFEASFNAFSTLMGAKPQFLDQYAEQRLPISQWVGQASW